jgi:RNA-directed DNA polymerase
MNVALHGMEAVVTQGSDDGHSREQPLLVRYADDFVILHPDLGELQQAVRRLKHWLARMGLHVNADKTRITHTLTPYQGQVGFDFLGFHIRQESVGKTPMGMGGQEHAPGLKAITPSLMGKLAPQEHRLRVKSIITPSQEAIKRHLAAIDQKLQQLQTAPQAQVIAELNPLIIGWAAHYNGVVEASTLRQYDDLVEQRLLRWASKRHPGQAQDWLLARYWHSLGKQKRVFATPEGVQLRRYRQTSILKG